MLLATGAIRWLTFSARLLCGGLLPCGNQLKGRRGVDSAIIAYDLGLPEATVPTLQRKMGLQNARPSRESVTAMIKFICVTDREAENGYCTLCTSKVTSP
jgi:hypothetical protein